MDRLLHCCIVDINKYYPQIDKRTGEEYIKMPVKNIDYYIGLMTDENTGREPATEIIEELRNIYDDMLKARCRYWHCYAPE